MPSRKVDKTVTPTYLIMQRLATNDPTAHLLERAQKGGAEIYHLCLPARVSDLVTPAEHKDQYQDGYLDIKRLGEDALSELEASLGPSEASGQLAQNPVPEGGTIIKRDWFEVIDPLDLPREVLEQQTNIFEDTALTKNKNNDPSGILCATMHENIIYLTYYWHGWLELHDLVEKNREIALAWGDEDTLICVENKANGADVINEMNRIYYNEFNVIGINETASKEVRLKNWASKIRAGKVKLVKGSWNTHFLDEVSGFGAVPHDESVDCLTMCCKYYSGGYDEGRQTESF